MHCIFLENFHQLEEFAYAEQVFLPVSNMVGNMGATGLLAENIASWAQLEGLSLPHLSAFIFLTINCETKLLKCPLSPI